MHREGNGADHTVCVIHEPDELPYGRLPHKIEHATKWRMPMSILAALDKLNSTQKMIDHLLIVGRGPPLGGEIIFPASQYHPKAATVAESLVHLIYPLPLIFT